MKKIIKEYYTVKGVDSNGKKHGISVLKNQYYFDIQPQMTYNLEGQRIVQKQSMGHLINKFGFDFFSEQLRYNLSHDKRNNTRICLFEAWNMTKLIIPEGVEELELFGCPSLEQIKLPESLEVLTIMKCENLASIDIPDNVHTLKISKNKFGENFNLPIHLANLTTDLNLLGEELMHYIDNEYVNVTLVGNDITLGI